MANSAKDPVQKAPPESDAAQAMTEKTPIFRDIYIKNVTANCPRDAGIIMGLPESGISNVVFENVNILAATGMKIENAKGIQFKNSKVRPDEDKPFIVKNAEVENQN
jgi:hypothetical protein